jgi:transcriptional regulator with XRE-family HTH domain
MTITPSQCRAGRALVEMDQSVLANRANVSRNVIIDFEKGRRVPGKNILAAIRVALESAGVEFIDADQPGVRPRASSADKDSAISDEAALPTALKKDEPYDGSPV